MFSIIIAKRFLCLKIKGLSIMYLELVELKCFNCFCCSLRERPTWQSCISFGSLGSAGLSVDVLSQNHSNQRPVSPQHCLFSQANPLISYHWSNVFYQALAVLSNRKSCVVIFGLVRKGWQYWLQVRICAIDVCLWQGTHYL